MIKIIVCGAMGKMGKSIVDVVINDSKTELIGAIEAAGHGSMGNVMDGNVKLTDNLEAIIGKADVIIDFTSPQSSLGYMELAGRLKKPIVIGTTGFSHSQQEQIEKIAASIPCVLAPNMSIGMNLLFKMAGDMARTLTGYDIEIVEIHHNKKKDAPSGTAKKLAEKLLEARKAGSLIYGREGDSALRKENEIGVHAVRAGDVVGDHTIIFAGNGERLEVVHRAHSRECLARGAVRAAKWVVSKPAGLYDMNDVLGLK